MSGLSKWIGFSLTTLRKRDPHNQTLAVLLLLILARVSKTYKGMRAYTMWNCSAVLCNYGFRIRNGWEQPLFCNSLAIFAAFRTASADAHSEFVKRTGMGNTIHVFGDQVIHTLPVVVIAISMIRHKRFARPQHGALALLGQLFFAYSQAGKMDLGEIYVKHDTTYAWAASGFGQLLAPTIINNLIVGRYRRALVAFLVVMSPYLLKKIGWRRLINKNTWNREKLIHKPGLFTSRHASDEDETRCTKCGQKKRYLHKKGLAPSKSLIDLPSLIG